MRKLYLFIKLRMICQRTTDSCQYWSLSLSPRFPAGDRRICEIQAAPFEPEPAQARVGTVVDEAEQTIAADQRCPAVKGSNSPSSPFAVFLRMSSKSNPAELDY